MKITPHLVPLPPSLLRPINQVFVGDHLESATAVDPSFWEIHPTMERLLHAKLMAGGFASIRALD